jgi:hypothetical protein
MKENPAEVKIVQRIPFPWAVSIVCVIALPLALFLGKFNFPVWVSFIVWAEYFTLGGTAKTSRLIFPSLPFGAIFAALWVATAVFYMTVAAHQLNLFIGLVIGALIWVTILMYAIPKSRIFTQGSLAVFNGISIFLGVYFTKSFPAVGPMGNPYWPILWAFIWAMLMAYLGWIFGWLNVALTFPKQVNA